MTKLIVDTNIIFSAILNIDSSIGKILLSPSSNYLFYSCYFLKEELLSHKSKILKITGFTEKEFLEIEYLVTKNIHFIHNEIISEKIVKKAQAICDVVDKKDTPFVALTLHLKGKLWTGDKKLINGLVKNNFNSIITTKQLT